MAIIKKDHTTICVGDTYKEGVDAAIVIGGEKKTKTKKEEKNIALHTPWVWS